MVALPANIEPSYGTDMSEEYRVRKVELGDGYSQRSADGLNTARQQWRLVWERLPDADAETLRQFFRNLRGIDIIDWTPYNQATQLKFTANGFSSKPVGYLKSTCSVTLTQEFDL